MRDQWNRYLPFLLPLAAAVMFIPFIGKMNLFDWDEINFAECAREMIVSGDYLNVQINFKPFWEKPPLFIWMQVLSMKLFGINEFAARFPNAVGGVITLLILYLIGKNLHSTRFGFWWAFIYASSILPQLYFRSGIIDPWFNLFIFLAVWSVVNYFHHSDLAKLRMVYAALGGLFIGLAVMTKGPAAFLILGLVLFVYLVISILQMVRTKTKGIPVQWRDLVLFALVAIFTGGFWFLLQIMNGHTDMVIKFIMYQVRLFTTPDAGHGGHWSYHAWVLLVGVFPASVFALLSLKTRKSDAPLLKRFHLFMLILFWVVLVLFSIVKTKIVHYSSLCYFPLTFMAAMTVMYLLEQKKRWNKGLSVLLLVITVLLVLVSIGLPIALIYKEKIIATGMIKDAFAVANLQADVKWSGLEGLGGLLLLAGVIYSLMVMKKHKSRALTIIFASSLMFTWITIMIFPYRIEKYSQGAAIEFFKSKAGEDCYVLNSGYFSYAPLFYARKMPENVRQPLQLLVGHNDKPLYLVLKEPHYEEWKHIIPAMELMYKKNGFVFLRRIDNRR